MKLGKDATEFKNSKRMRVTPLNSKRVGLLEQQSTTSTYSFEEVDFLLLGNRKESSSGLREAQKYTLS